MIASISVYLDINKTIFGKVKIPQTFAKIAIYFFVCNLRKYRAQGCSSTIFTHFFIHIIVKMVLKQACVRCFLLGKHQIIAPKHHFLKINGLRNVIFTLRRHWDNLL